MDLQKAVLLSCHQTLVRLGDLSRWRETQLVSKNRNWGPAIGYYQLAGAIYASSGACHHQLAVIAQVDDDHFRTIYHLYRALAVAEPHPGARRNLEIELGNTAEASAKKNSIVDSPVKVGSLSRDAFTRSFLRLHATFFGGSGYPDHDELENEVVELFVEASMERSRESNVRKLVLINLAAEYCAGLRLRGKGQNVHNVSLLMPLRRKSTICGFAPVLALFYAPEYQDVLCTFACP